MARIVGAIASSHTPTIGFALDARKQEDPVWKPIFEAYAPIREWLEAKRPDVLLCIYNDHITSFFFDHYSAFCLGVDDSYEVADEGGGRRAMPPIGGHPELSRHIAQSLVTDEFDMSFFRDKALDTAASHPCPCCSRTRTGGRSASCRSKPLGRRTKVMVAAKCISCLCFGPIIEARSERRCRSLVDTLDSIRGRLNSTSMTQN